MAGDLIYPPEGYDEMVVGCGRLAMELSAELNAPISPSTIYHYTDDVGLRGILETGELWLTDIYSLNDPSEVRYALNKGIAALQRLAEEMDEGHVRAASIFQQAIDTYLKDPTYSFVCSFSRTRDDIGQWRAYADDGQGYALAFDAPSLGKAFTGTNPEGTWARTFQVQYGGERLSKFLEGLMTLARPAMKGGQPNFIYGYLLSLIIANSLFFKHPAYESEKEFRFHLHNSGSALLMPSSHGGRRHALVRLCKFNWRKTGNAALKKIIVGPAADQARGVRFAKDCLAAFHKGDVAVEQSDIPYRRTRD